MFVHAPKTARKRKKKTRRSKPPTAGRARHLVDQVPYRITGAVHVLGQSELPPEYESFLERDAIMLLAMCADVGSILSQSEKNHYPNAEGGQSRYTHDLLVEVAELGSVRVEVKPLRRLLSERVSAEIQILAQNFISERQRFEILTDDAIRMQPRLDNVRRLRAFLRHCMTAGARERITTVLNEGPRVIDELIREIGDPDTWSDVLALVARQDLCIDWTKPLSRQTLVSLPNAPFPRLSYEQIVRSGRFRPLVDELVLGRRPANRQLLAAALREDRSVPLADPFAAVGGISKRSLYVGRAVDGCYRSDDDERVAPVRPCVVLEHGE